MNSGAGHDAQLFVRICPAAILFVPSQAGISHSPFEYTSSNDLETGLQVLTQLLHQLAYK
jgi:allantoate deiminase